MVIRLYCPLGVAALSSTLLLSDTLLVDPLLLALLLSASLLLAISSAFAVIESVAGDFTLLVVSFATAISLSLVGCTALVFELVFTCCLSASVGSLIALAAVSLSVDATSLAVPTRLKTSSGAPFSTHCPSLTKVFSMVIGCTATNEVCLIGSILPCRPRLG